MNPPYGKRIKSSADLRNLFAQLGKVLRARLPGWQVALYSPDARFASQLDLDLVTLFRTSNGGIKVAALGGKVA